jgi:hypothetical protein
MLREDIASVFELVIFIHSLEEFNIICSAS